MLERLKAIDERYQELEKELADPEVYSNMNKMKSLSKEKRDLEETVECYHQYQKTLKGIEEDKELVKDPEMAEIAREELESLISEKQALEERLQVLLIPKDPNDGKNVIVEI